MFAESPPERTGRRRSMPGSSDKTTPTMEPTTTAATPFRVTVSTVSLFFFMYQLFFFFAFALQAVSNRSIVLGVQMDVCQSHLLQMLE